MVDESAAHLGLGIFKLVEDWPRNFGGAGSTIGLVRLFETTEAPEHANAGGQQRFFLRRQCTQLRCGSVSRCYPDTGSRGGVSRL